MFHLTRKLPTSHFLTFIFLSFLVLTGCNNDSSGDDQHAGHDHGPGSKPAQKTLKGEGPFKVVVTIGMIADGVSAIMGDSAEMTVLMGPGTDPHLYTPTRDDVVALRNADLIVYNGFHLEGRMVDQLSQMAKDKPVINLGNLIAKDELIKGEEGEVDPHLWTSVRIWADGMDSLAEELAKVVPARASEYQVAGDVYSATLRELHESGIAMVATVPEELRVVVSAHDAFEYFGREYGFEVLAIQGLSTEAEAGLSDINNLVKTITERKIPAVFFETSVPKKSIDALIEGAQAKGHDVNKGGVLYSDAMGEPETPEGTYYGMMKHNLTTVVGALGGETNLENQEHE